MEVILVEATLVGVTSAVFKSSRYHLFLPSFGFISHMFSATGLSLVSRYDCVTYALAVSNVFLGSVYVRLHRNIRTCFGFL